MNKKVNTPKVYNCDNDSQIATVQFLKIIKMEYDT